MSSEQDYRGDAHALLAAAVEATSIEEAAANSLAIIDQAEDPSEVAIILARVFAEYLKQHGDTDFVHQLGVHLAEWEWKRM